MYTPLLQGQLDARQACRNPTCADLVQEVFAILVVKLPEFVYDHNRSFRGWLRTILQITSGVTNNAVTGAKLPMEGDHALANQP